MATKGKGKGQHTTEEEAAPVTATEVPTTEEPTVSADGQTETVNTDGQTETAEATEEPKPEGYFKKDLDAFGTQALEILKGQIAERNALHKSLSAANKDRHAVLSELEKDYDGAAFESDPERFEAYKALVAEIDELGNRLWELEERRRNDFLSGVAEEMIANSKESADSVSAKVKEADEAIDGGIKYLTQIFGLHAIENLPVRAGKRAPRGTAGTSTSGTGTGTGSGGKRVRGFNVYVTPPNGTETIAQAPDKDGKQQSNLAAASKVVGVDTETLRDAFWANIGTKESAQYPDEATFTISNDKGETFTVRMQRRSE